MGSIVLSGSIQSVFWEDPDGDRIGAKFGKGLTVWGTVPVQATYFHYKLQCDQKKGQGKWPDSFEIRKVLEWRRLPLTIDMLKTMLRKECTLSASRIAQMIRGYPDNTTGEELLTWVEAQPWYEDVHDKADYFRHKYVTVLFRYYTASVVQTMDYYLAEGVYEHLKVSPIDLCFMRRIRKVFGDDARVPELPPEGFLLACSDFHRPVAQHQRDALTLYHQEILVRMRVGHTAVLLNPRVWDQPRTVAALQYISTELGVVHVYDDRQHMCLTEVYNDELAIGQAMRSLFQNQHIHGPPTPPEDEEDKEKEMVLNEDQQRSVTVACEHPMLCITGGPGTGKTSTAREIVHRLGEGNFLSVSFTGKAACNLTERVTKSMTIHRALSVIYSQMGSHHSDPVLAHSGDEETQLEDQNVTEPEQPQESRGKKTKKKKGRDNMEMGGIPLAERPYLLIDEMSNVELNLFAKILREMRSLRLLVLIGDVNQIESIGPGSVFMDYLQHYTDSPYIIRLEHVYRVNDNSVVLNECARHVLAREPQKITEKAHRDIEDGHPITVMPRSREIVDDVFRILAKFPDQHHFQFIVYKNQARQEINRIVYEYLFGGKRVGKGKRVGEKIMFTKNNYGGSVRGYKSVAVSNGEFAFIERIYDLNLKTDKTTEVDSTSQRRSIARKNSLRFMVLKSGKTLCLDLRTNYKFDTGYACTVHKMQGSECDDVCLYIERNPQEHFNWKLLYTAMTRSRNTLTIICCCDRNKITDFNNPGRIVDIDQIVRFHNPVERVTTLQQCLSMSGEQQQEKEAAETAVHDLEDEILQAEESTRAEEDAAPETRSLLEIGSSDEEDSDEGEELDDGFIVSDHESSDGEPPRKRSRVVESDTDSED